MKRRGNNACTLHNTWKVYEKQNGVPVRRCAICRRQQQRLLMLRRRGVPDRFRKPEAFAIGWIHSNV